MDPALEAYDALAPIYDDFTHRNDYEAWIRALLPELEKRGLNQGRLLDIGCGTGRAFEPMLRRGWEITGCDLTPAMLVEAQGKFGAAVPLALADMRELPVFGKFDLAWALNAVVNCLVEDGDLERAFTGVRSNLAPQGRFLFDVNSLKLFETHFTRLGTEELSAGQWGWTGLTERVVPGGTFEARISGDGVETHVHRQRHYSIDRIGAAIEASGLEMLGILGQRERQPIALVDGADETRHDRIVYIAGPKG